MQACGIAEEEEMAPDLPGNVIIDEHGEWFPADLKALLVSAIDARLQSYHFPGGPEPDYLELRKAASEWPR